MISRRFSCVNGTHLQRSFLVSSSKSGATAFRICWQLPLQLPQPVEARVDSFNCASVRTPF